GRLVVRALSATRLPGGWIVVPDKDAASEVCSAHERTNEEAVRDDEAPQGVSPCPAGRRIHRRGTGERTGSRIRTAPAPARIRRCGPSTAPRGARPHGARS